MREDRCGQGYDHYGDIYECRLEFNHDHNCEDANHHALVARLEFQASLDERTRQVQGPWL